MNAPDAPPPVPSPGRDARDFLRRLAPAAAIAGLNLLVFSIARLIIFLSHRGDFSSLSGSEVFRSFLRGIRFDASAIFPVLGLPLFLLLLPVGGPRGIVWRRVWGWILFGLFAIFLLILGIDAVYYGVVHRHAGIEATQPEEVLIAVANAGAVQYALPLLGFLVLVGAAFFGWRWLLARDPGPWKRPAVQVGAALFLAVLMYFAERGTLTGKRLRVVHAFQDAPLEGGNLALNGPYCILHSLVHSRAVRTSFYPWPDALQSAQEAILSPEEQIADPHYPLLRSKPPRTGDKPNIVVVILESWDASACDVHRRELGMPPIHCTPNYDAAAAGGVLFSRCYATGQRSMDGLSATLCGFPSLPGTPYIGRGLEQSLLSGLGRLGRKEGYDTWFITASERDSFRLDAVAALTGFDHLVAAEDTPAAPPVAPRGILKGPCWDHEMYKETVRRLSTARRPFLAYLYTAATHHPFAWPDERWARRPTGTLENRYLNSLEYADWALGEFFKSSREAGWFDRTIFILVADHIGGPGYGLRRDDPSTLHHIPCLILAPGLKPGIDRRVVGQLDVIPTLADLAGWSAPHAALGTSMFADPVASRGALCVQGNLVLRVEDGGFVLHSLTDRVLSTGDANAIERRLLSLIQTSFTLLRTNRIARGD